ncbi:MAG: GRP family sugar transporter [Candidatus Saccharibacteria bacterium]|nr:GRP family sugar transporter [Candidatus Saccharibacteria bacterium]
MFGYLLAIISSLFYSFYVVPRKLSKLKPLDFSFLMATGFFVGSTVLYLFKPVLKFHEHLSPVLLLTVLAGGIWALAFVTFVRAIDSIGLSRSNQWKNLQGPIASILSLIILSEWKTTDPAFVLLAGLAVFISAICFTISSSKEEAKKHRDGAYLAGLAGLGFGIVAVIQKYVTIHTGVYTQQVVWSFSIAIVLAIYIIASGKKLPRLEISKPDVRLALGAGLLYLGASFFQLQSFRHLPSSIAFIVIQLNTFWTIGIGIFFFKEISARKHYKRILLGTLFVILGIISFTLAKK